MSMLLRNFRVPMQQQQPSNIKWQRLALRARSRMELRVMLAARILGPKYRASVEESAKLGQVWLADKEI